MSEGIMFSATSAQRRDRGRPMGRRLLWTLVIILLLLVTAEIVFQLVLMPRMRITRTLIESDLGISEQRLLSIAGIGGKLYYFSVDTQEIESRLESYPIIREATVEKVFPDALSIRVEGRSALALSLSRVDGQTVPVAVDREGVVFQVGQTVTNLDLPVLSGLSFTPLLGLELPELLQPLLADLDRLREEAPELFRLISEIKVVAVNEVDYELTLYPAGYPVRVQVGRRLDATFLRYVFMVLDVLQSQGLSPRVKEIDLRTGSVVYAANEERDEG